MLRKALPFLAAVGMAALHKAVERAADIMLKSLAEQADERARNVRWGSPNPYQHDAGSKARREYRAISNPYGY